MSWSQHLRSAQDFIKVGDEVTLGNAKDAKTTYTYTVCGLYEYTAPAEGAAPFAKDVPDNVLYDLNGRRVLYPSRGIYVTAGGQRIFLK